MIYFIEISLSFRKFRWRCDHLESLQSRFYNRLKVDLHSGDIVVNLFVLTNVFFIRT